MWNLEVSRLHLLYEVLCIWYLWHRTQSDKDKLIMNKISKYSSRCSWNDQISPPFLLVCFFVFFSFFKARLSWKASSNLVCQWIVSTFTPLVRLDGFLEIMMLERTQTLHHESGFNELPIVIGSALIKRMILIYWHMMNILWSELLLFLPASLSTIESPFFPIPPEAE